MATNYRYNSLNQIVGSYHPDHDSTALVMYDILSRPVISQNGKQKATGNFYSYTLFDPIGRIIEVGQLDGGGSAITPAMVKNPTALSNYINSGYRMEVTKTYYDRFIFYTSSQVNLRNRIADITYSDYYSTDPLNYQSATHFSYDIHVNVKNLQQEIRELYYLNDGLFTMDYEYDLISGNVNKVYYQKGRADQFIHRYRYDADNRLTHVYTSDIVGDYNPLIERLEAKYIYLPHGPLARVELGKKSIQGLDYAYTLQGWLKDINGFRNDISSTNVYDIGKDGSATNYTNKRFGRDGFATMLQYYTGDYIPINGNNYFNLGSPNSVGLYNGNISALSLGIDTLNPMLKSFRYDKLNRIKMMESAYLSNNIWGVLSNRFGTEYSYDFNGNITNLSRRDETATLLHDIGYTYEQDRNRLRGIEVNGTEIRSSSYHYDALGNLITDDIEEINVDWNVIGKVKFVQTPNNRLNFAYNPFGQRQIKRTDNDTTYYVHDATGNVMGIYIKDDLTLTTKERPIYGSSRLGIMNKAVVFNLNGGLVSKSNSTIGIKEYELSDHLGNVSVVVLDRKNSLSTDIQPIIISNTDYYPFGYPISFRTHSTGYRYGFNGQEGDGEIYGDKLNYAFQYRMYDARIGRFWSVDPLRFDYPFYSSYQFAGNTPIQACELEGLEPTYPKTLKEWNSPQLKKTTGQSIRDWWNFGGTSKIKGFNSNDYDRFSAYIDLNFKRKQEGQSYKELPYKGICKYNCINNANAAFQILLNNYNLPIKPNYRQFLTEMAKQGLAGPETEIWATYRKADGSYAKHVGYPSMGVIAGFQSSVSAQLLKEAKAAGLGYHFFGVEIGDGFHSVIASVYYDEDGDVEFGIYDQNASSSTRIGLTQKEFDEWFINYMNKNSTKDGNWIGLGKENFGVEHKTVIRIRKIIKK